MKNATRIAVILDRSGSMDAVLESTIDSVNEFIKGQKAVPGECTLDLVLFDGFGSQSSPAIQLLYSKPIADAELLTRKTYVPRGMTPLYDAIGVSVARVGSELAALAESDRPNKVMIIVVTDGDENASREYTQKRIADIIKMQREVYSWEFLFLGANQDAVLTAKGLNIGAGQSLSFSASAAGLVGTTVSLGRYATCYRSFAGSPYEDAPDLSFTDEERAKSMGNTK